MTNAKSTKRSLWTSAVSLIICFAMLLGTTFAWFSDSVTSANNIITSGNLDIELEYWNGTEWVDVKDKSDILTNTLWEPGATEVAYLRVANAGSLALRYQLGINIVSETEGVNVAGETFKLSDYILFDVVEGVNGETGAYANREAAVAAVSEAQKISTGYGKSSTMLPDDELYLALVVYMPTTVGNEANHNGVNKPTIELGINVVATQYTQEDDSFGSDYDKDAWTEGMQVQTADDLQAAINNGVTNIVLTEDIEIYEPVVIPAAPSTYSMRSAAPTVVIDLNGKTINTAFAQGSTTNHVYAFTNNGNLLLTNGTINARGIFNYGNLTVENVTINAIDGNGGYAVRNYAGSTFTMNSGKIATTLEDDHKVNAGGYDATTLRVDAGASAVINGGIIENICDYTFAIDNAGDVVVNGGTVTSVHSTISNYGTITINGGSFTCNGVEGITAHVVVAWGGSTTTINGGTFDGKDNYNGFNVDAAAGSNVAIHGGSFLKAHSGSLYGDGTIEVDGGEFVDDPSSRVVSGLSAHKDNGVYIILPGDNTECLSDGFFYNSDADTYYITSADGLFAFAASVNKYSNYEYPYSGETVLLMNDIDLGGAEWTPIGDYRFSANRFCGTFDGQGHTVSNFKITKKTDKNDSNKSSYGFFGNVEGTVKNLTVANSTVSSYAYCGALVGRLNSGLVENCHVVSCTVATSYWQGGIMFGQVNGGSVKNCTVSGSSISGKSALGGMFGPVTAEGGDILFENCSVKNSAINQVGSFGGSYDRYFGGMFGYLESGDNRIDINNCTVTNTTVKGKISSVLSGDNDGNIYFNGVKAITSAAEFEAAVMEGGYVLLGANIAMENTLMPTKDFVVDGNGYTITMAGGCVNTYALFDSIPTGVTYEFKNVTFDGIKGGAIVRSIGANGTFDNVIVKNCEHTQQQGLLRLVGENTIKNCTFINNNCSILITLNYDTANNSAQLVENCVFEGNTCNGTAVLYYVKGAGATINANKFVNNTVNCNSNGATVYMGFTENNVITNNLFQGNVVTDSSSSTRVAGGVFFGYEAVFENNSFIGNKASNADGAALGNDVCVSIYYTDIDLSGNYWGGSAPVVGVNYFVQHLTSGNAVILNSYIED